MNNRFKYIYRSFLAVLFKLCPFILAVAVETISVVFKDIKLDLTIYILINISIWMLVISIINKTLFKYYIVGFDETQYDINIKLSSGIFAKLCILAAIGLNICFYILGQRHASIMIIELMLLAIADAIIEVKIRLYIQE